MRGARLRFLYSRALLVSVLLPQPVRIGLRLHAGALVAPLEHYCVAWFPVAAWEAAATAASQRAAALLSSLGRLVTLEEEGAQVNALPPAAVKGAQEQLQADFMWFEGDVAAAEGGAAFSAPVRSLVADTAGDAFDGSETRCELPSPPDAGQYVVALCARVPMRRIASGLWAALEDAGQEAPAAADAPVLYPVAILSGGGTSGGRLTLTAPSAPQAAPAVPMGGAGGAASSAAAAAPGAEDDDDFLDAGGGIDMYTASGAVSPEALAKSGPLHERLLQRALRLYRAVYAAKGVPAAMIDGMITGMAGRFTDTPVIGLVSMFPSLKQMLQ